MRARDRECVRENGREGVKETGERCHRDTESQEEPQIDRKQRAREKERGPRKRFKVCISPSFSPSSSSPRSYTVGVAFYMLGFAETTRRRFTEWGVLDWTDVEAGPNIFPWNSSGHWIDTMIASIGLALLAGVSLLGVVVGSRILTVVLGLIFLSIFLSVACLLASDSDNIDGYAAVRNCVCVCLCVCLCARVYVVQ